MGAGDRVAELNALRCPNCGRRVVDLAGNEVLVRVKCQRCGMIVVARKQGVGMTVETKRGKDDN